MSVYFVALTDITVAEKYVKVNVYISFYSNTQIYKIAAFRLLFYCSPFTSYLLTNTTIAAPDGAVSPLGIPFITSPPRAVAISFAFSALALSTATTCVLV